MLVQSLRPHWQKRGWSQLSLCSLLGTPLDSLQSCDPCGLCHCQRQRRVREKAAKLNLDDAVQAAWLQSRCGRAAWLQPYASELLLGWEGISEVAVIGPAFADDCRATLKEITGENRALFRDAPLLIAI